jgi:hypothetical protein
MDESRAFLTIHEMINQIIVLVFHKY